MVPRKTYEVVQELPPLAEPQPSPSAWTRVADGGPLDEVGLGWQPFLVQKS